MDNITFSKIATRGSSTLHIFGGFGRRTFSLNARWTAWRNKTSCANKKKKEAILKVSHLRIFQMKNSPSNKRGERWLLLYAIDNGDHVGFFFGIASARLYAITINSTADSGSYSENVQDSKRSIQLCKSFMQTYVVSTAFI